MLQNSPKNRQALLLLSAITVLVLASSCRKPPAETARGVDVGDAKAASEKIAEADKLYAERGDLAKVRQAVALLRQAQIEDYGSFEAAWKLARADYYLGEHSTDDSLSDSADLAVCASYGRCRNSFSACERRPG